MLGFDSNCCNGVTSNKSHGSSPHSHKPCPPGSGSTLPASDISLNGSRSQQPITRYGEKPLNQCFRAHTLKVALHFIMNLFSGCQHTDGTVR